jgi:hypothetical protein
MEFPPTPNLAVSVRAALVREAPNTRNNRWWLGAAAGVAAAAVLVAIGVFVLTPRGSNHAVSANSILLHAAHTRPANGQVIHLVYRLKVEAAGSSIDTPMNVWDSYANGVYTTVDVHRNPVITAVRFVESNGNVRHSWSTHMKALGGKLRSLGRSPLAGQDGRLIAWRVLALKGSNERVHLDGVRMVAGRQAYVLRVHAAQSEGGPFTLAYDTHTYDLLSASAPGFQDRLASKQALKTSVTPQLILGYLKSPKKIAPTVASVGAY